MAGNVLLDLLHSQRQPSQIYCAFVSDWFLSEWIFFLFAESVVKGFGSLPAANQVLSLRTWAVCASLPPQELLTLRRNWPEHVQHLLLLHPWWQLCLLSVKTHQECFIGSQWSAGLHSFGADILKERQPKRVAVCLGREPSSLDLAFSQLIVPSLPVIPFQRTLPVAKALSIVTGLRNAHQSVLPMEWGKSSALFQCR